MKTELLYMKDMQGLTCSASILEKLTNDDRDVIILDQTIFYPQGGGQPYDTGFIKNEDESFVFEVEEVRFIEGTVHHIGILKAGSMNIGTKVYCFVDKERRLLNTSLHSAGHLVDLALKELDVDWVPGKGYHFPQGAYIEYAGSLNGHNIEKLKQDITDKVEEIMGRNIQTKLVFDESKLQNGKPMRTVYYGDFGIPCGGTHIANLSDIGRITIRKIKMEKENIRVSYSIANI
ncbi:MAG: alanine--tRNA ligase-related protein [Candidatus Paceibacterota bacterium]